MEACHILPIDYNGNASYETIFVTICAHLDEAEKDIVEWNVTVTDDHDDLIYMTSSHD